RSVAASAFEAEELRRGEKGEGRREKGEGRRETRCEDFWRRHAADQLRSERSACERVQQAAPAGAAQEPAQGQGSVRPRRDAAGKTVSRRKRRCARVAIARGGVRRGRDVREPAWSGDEMGAQLAPPFAGADARRRTRSECLLRRRGRALL